MREIKFRGKRIDNGKWVYGFMATDKHGNAYIFDDGYMALGDNFCANNSYSVMPSTLGEFTGLHDKNGREIYEGDIFALTTADGERITITCKFGKARRQIYENLVEITGFYFERSNDARKTFPIIKNYLGKHDIEIWERIGTIHDPENIKQLKQKEAQDAKGQDN